MQLRYFRFHTFVFLMRRFSAQMRRRRMATFRRLIGLRPGMTVLDLGGHPDIWQHIPEPLDITILNLPGEVVVAAASHHRFRYIEGDACDVRQFADRQFDLVFSNSVIEHVGPAQSQRRFAAEVSRLGKAYWVQTPSRWFPLEAHCGMPFWWFYGEGLRHALLRRWRRKLPAWSEMVAGTRVLTREQLRCLFPDGEMFTEYSMGIPKSYAIFHRAPATYRTADAPAAETAVGAMSSAPLGLDPAALGMEQKAQI